MLILETIFYLWLDRRWFFVVERYYNMNNIFELTKALGGLVFEIVKLGVVIVGIITILKHW